MTVFDKNTDLPVNVNTVEKLASWVLLLLYFIHKKDTYPETEEVGNVSLITCQQGMAEDGTERLIFRVSMKLESSWFTNPLKLWLQTDVFANSTIPNIFKS